jgi:hypothetical protein
VSEARDARVANIFISYTSADRDWATRFHVAHCVEHAIASGNRTERRKKIEALVNVASRADR